MPLLGAGFAAKGALEAMSDVLRVELSAVGIKVIVIEPGMTKWRDVEAQIGVYDEALDAGVAAVQPAARARYSRAADAFKQVNRRMLDRAAASEDVAAVIERALTARRPRARYNCGPEQKFAAVLSRLTPLAVRDHVVRRIVRI
jgi:NAD(P)-dependent dehydrogenase (short-subunit alcohol dehydrogenase family)